MIGKLNVIRNGTGVVGDLQRVGIIGVVPGQAGSERIHADYKIRRRAVRQDATDVEQAPVHARGPGNGVHLHIVDRPALPNHIGQKRQPVGVAQGRRNHRPVGQHDPAAPRHDCAAAGQFRVTGDQQPAAKVVEPTHRIEHRPIRHGANDDIRIVRPVANDKGLNPTAGSICDRTARAVEQAAAEREGIVRPDRQLVDRHRAGPAHDKLVVRAASHRPNRQRPHVAEQAAADPQQVPRRHASANSEVAAAEVPEPTAGQGDRVAVDPVAHEASAEAEEAAAVGDRQAVAPVGDAPQPAHRYRRRIAEHPGVDRQSIAIGHVRSDDQRLAQQIPDNIRIDVDRIIRGAQADHQPAAPVGGVHHVHGIVAAVAANRDQAIGNKDGIQTAAHVVHVAAAIALTHDQSPAVELRPIAHRHRAKIAVRAANGQRCVRPDRARIRHHHTRKPIRQDDERGRDTGEGARPIQNKDIGGKGLRRAEQNRPVGDSRVASDPELVAQATHANGQAAAVEPERIRPADRGAVGNGTVGQICISHRVGDGVCRADRDKVGGEVPGPGADRDRAAPELRVGNEQPVKSRRAADCDRAIGSDAGAAESPDLIEVVAARVGAHGHDAAVQSAAIADDQAIARVIEGPIPNHERAPGEVGERSAVDDQDIAGRHPVANREALGRTEQIPSPAGLDDRGVVGAAIADGAIIAQQRRIRHDHLVPRLAAAPHGQPAIGHRAG